jgi:hypothetical protein
VHGDNEVLAAVEKTVEALVAKKFPGLDMKKLETEAQARYPIYKKGDFVEFFYATNPQIVRKVRGIYHGRNVRLVQVGSSAIQLEDIARVKGNEDLLLRFDPEASEALRKTYIEEKQAAYKEKKEDYERKVRAYTWDKEYARMQQANQAQGFLFGQPHHRGAGETGREGPPGAGTNPTGKAATVGRRGRPAGRTRRDNRRGHVRRCGRGVRRLQGTHGRSRGGGSQCARTRRGDDSRTRRGDHRTRRT